MNIVLTKNDNRGKLRGWGRGNVGGEGRREIKLSPHLLELEVNGEIIYTSEHKHQMKQLHES